MSKMNVAIVYHFFAHYRGPILQELLRNSAINYILVADDHDPMDEGTEAWKITAPSRYIHTPCKFYRSKYLLQNGVLELALRRDINTIIYLGDANFITTWISAIFARLSGKRVLFWTHGWLKYESGLKSKVRNRFYKLAHGLLLYGNRAKEIGIRNGFDPNNLYVIYNSMDYALQKKYRDRINYDQLCEIRKKMFSKYNCPIIICTGRLIKERKLEVLFQSLHFLKSKGLEANLLLVGEGPEHQILQEEAESMRLTVKFFGECYDEKILSSLIMASNLTVSPGRMGLTAIHSLAYGTPVVTHANFDQQVPEVEAIIPGENGDLFRQDDYIDLANVIEKWVSRNWPDDDLRKKCYGVVEKYYNAKYQATVINDAVLGKLAH